MSELGRVVELTDGTKAVLVFESLMLSSYFTKYWKILDTARSTSDPQILSRKSECPSQNIVHTMH